MRWRGGRVRAKMTCFYNLYDYLRQVQNRELGRIAVLRRVRRTFATKRASKPSSEKARARRQRQSCTCSASGVCRWARFRRPEFFSNANNCQTACPPDYRKGPLDRKAVYVE